jgi:DNA topoisomerase-1
MFALDISGKEGVPRSMAKSAAGKTLVIVESPTKAKTIRKFLGKGYIVESCMGHIRDLPQSAKDIPEKWKKEEWAPLGVNVDKGFTPIYAIPKNKVKVVTNLRGLVKEAKDVILATDEDREGESISWHLFEVLKPKVPVRRMVFHEITKDAINESLEKTRDINDDLVRAQEARRILDRLVGYSISPLLWKKIAYGLSAGRVQSVAVRLICERELERLKFKKAEYYGLEGACEKDKTAFKARLNSYEGKKIAHGKDFDPNTGEIIDAKKNEILALDESAAEKISKEVQDSNWKVKEVEEKPFSRKPAAPFITSTLQQEASRKLGFSASYTMRIAQSLYEQGYITYMRTDSTSLSTQAVTAARAIIKKLYGNDYLPEAPRDYSSKKVKGAQEAHEAIRPAGTNMETPEETGLEADLLRLYELIWKRTVASQMANSRQKQVNVKISAGSALFYASGMTIEFPGFLRAYVEGSDDPEGALDDREIILPKLKENDEVKCKNIDIQHHVTKPTPRFTEASLIQTMEKEGIGRPSTYAPILKTITDRGYVQRHGNALAPTFTALVVANLLKNHFPQYVDTAFTSEMEKSLDDIAEGDLDLVKYLKSIYSGKTGLKSQVAQQADEIVPEEAREIQLEGLDGFHFRVGRYGAYVCKKGKKEEDEISVSLPESHAPADVTPEMINKLIDQKINGTDALGKDEETGLPVYALNGRYGPYVQLGDDEGGKSKPKRMAVPPFMDAENITLEQALQLLSLPRSLGEHPESGKDIKAGIGRFGPYVVHDGDFRAIPKTESVFEIDYDKAVELLNQPKRGRGAAAALKELGKHPQTGDEVGVYDGRYGPYVKVGSVNASLPEGLNPKDVTLDRAIEILAPKLTKKLEKAAKKKAKTKKKKTAKKTKKSAAKKTVKKAAGTKKTKKTAKKAASKTDKKTRTSSKRKKRAKKSSAGKRVILRKGDDASAST